MTAARGDSVSEETRCRALVPRRVYAWIAKIETSVSVVTPARVYRRNGTKRMPLRCPTSQLRRVCLRDRRAWAECNSPLQHSVRPYRCRDRERIVVSETERSNLRFHLCNRRCRELEASAVDGDVRRYIDSTDAYTRFAGTERWNRARRTGPSDDDDASAAVCRKRRHASCELFDIDLEAAGVEVVRTKERDAWLRDAKHCDWNQQRRSRLCRNSARYCACNFCFASDELI